MERFNSWENSVSRFFSFNELPADQVNRRVTLINLCLATIVAGTLWIFGYYFLDIVKATFPVAIYILLTIANLFVFYLTKRYNLFRNIQLFFILVMPVATQLCLGGYMKGSGVILAAMLAPMGAAIFINRSAAYRFFILYMSALLIGGGIEFYSPDLGLVDIPHNVNLAFFIINYSFISFVYLITLTVFLTEKEKIQTLLKEKNVEILEKNEELTTQREKIAAQRDHLDKHNQELVRVLDQVEKQNKIIQEKNTAITQSIRYAKNLQQTILVSPEEIAEIFPDSFIFYLPKDIVSGDFYWFQTMDEHILFAVADCTGHGIPGAFISLLCSNMIYREVAENQLTDPGLILTAVNKQLKMAFANRRTMFQATDGMDISFCAYHKNWGKILFAGAANGIFKVTPDGEAMEMKGDHRSIGGLGGKDFNFTTRHIKVNPGDMIYLYSDGYKDQFAEDSDKKFMAKRFKALLKDIAADDCSSQEKALEDVLNNWRGTSSQIDDITIFGIRIP